ncbi:hypothetical protein H634G_07627 [Metarhizium anisopliae BRIP 53293]|uniref:Uncharacterized protein n=1 Tax=Metarhizium anisopliae BRIP 53293 TaxID=1291518 RepID=A0A0D9NTB6_METAN|nr:hypothetical protein H634G_07627 [Metarhizium anisopliae BRIP 53293]KJK90220.1 hypothetical protein H633G_05929 [Metarhizium anisopliae BRIP 53284]
MTPEPQSAWRSVWHIIQVHLNSTSTHSHAPPGFDHALTRVCESQESPQRRLLEHSVFAWVALISNQIVRTGFNQLLPKDEKALLKNVRKLRPSAATKERIRQIFARKQRQEQLKEAGLGWLLDFEHAPTQSQKQKRSEAQEEVPNHTASPEKMETLVSAGHDLDLGHPLLEHLLHIFHPRMCDRIVQKNGHVEVGIYYDAHLTKFLLNIRVLRESIPHLAIRLFGCCLAEVSTGWVLEVEQGPDVNLGGNGHLRLSRASVDAVGLFIGTPIRELVDRGNETTTLLSLYVWGTPKSNGLIQIEAPVDRLCSIVVSKLWPQF